MGDLPFVVFSNDNPDAVLSCPAVDAVFTANQRFRITSIRTYHWNGGAGTEAAGSITLLDGDGLEVGTWACSGSSGQAGAVNANWECAPNVEIESGTYTVVDSDPATWSYNSASGDAGICVVMGVALGDTTGAGDAPPGDKPDAVVKRFFDAQMAGDIDGMLPNAPCTSFRWING